MSRLDADREMLARWVDEWEELDASLTLRDGYSLVQLRADLDALAAQETAVAVAEERLRAAKARPDDADALNEAIWYATLARELRQSRIRSLRARRKAFRKAADPL